MAKGVSNLAKMALHAGRASENTEVGTDIVDIITFVEAEWGLAMSLYPVQRVILKAYYGIALDNDPAKRFCVSDWKREDERWFTEAEYLEYLFEEGRCNIREVVPGHERRHLILSIGRRSGKTLLSSCISAYETYKLINKGNPQRYYGLSPSSTIQLISVATSKDQAGLLYKEVQGHFLRCAFFQRYMANSTESFARFQTPHDIDEFGTYHDNQKARTSIKVTFHACNAKGLRGAGNVVVILDEVAHFIEQGGSSADQVYQAVGPSVGTFTPKGTDGMPIDGPQTQSDGRIIMISSPLGKQGLFYERFRDGFKGGSMADSMLCVQAPTWEVNPTISAQYLVGEYQRDPRIFFTEFGGEFTDRTLGWLEDPADLLSCIDKNLRPKTRGIPRRPYFVGFDLALVGDASAVAIVHIDELNRIVLDYIGRRKAGEGEDEGKERLEFDDVADWLHDLSRKFRFHKGLFDQWGAIPLEQALARKGVTELEGQLFTQQEKSAIWQNFKSMLWDRVDGDKKKPRIVLYDITPEDKAKYAARDEKAPEHLGYITELLELQATYKSKYVIDVHAPQTDGKHDDMADALARAVWLASQSLGKLKHIAGSKHDVDPNRPQPNSRMRRLNYRKRLLGGSDPKRQVPKRRR
jgi:hypothetical protein